MMSFYSWYFLFVSVSYIQPSSSERRAENCNIL